MKNSLRALFAAVALSVGLIASASVQASLVGRLETDLGSDVYQAVYDTDLNITWLANANLAKTNTFGVKGINPAHGYMAWNPAQSWIDAMNAANYLGFHDWRLPTTLQLDTTCGTQSSGMSYGLNCKGSEMGHLFYAELGGAVGQTITTTHNAGYDLFQNIQSGIYWSESERNAGYAWFFSLNNGGQSALVTKYGNFYAWAVRPGDVVATLAPGNITAVPVPAAAWLLGSGLLGLAGLARRPACMKCSDVA